MTRISERRGSVGKQDVAEHAGGTIGFTAPRQHLECSGVRLGQHVRLVHTGESLDARAVEADALTKSTLEFGRSNGHGFQHTENVGEP